MKRLVLVDGNALLHRAYHATPPLSTSKGELVNAVFGFTSMLLRSLEELKPDYTAVAWDMKAPTFRHTEFAGYKATRKPMEDGLAGQYKHVHQVLEAFNIPEFSLAGFEADDLVGTLARQAVEKEKALEVIIVTGDWDITQLINKRIRVLLPKKTLADVGLYGEEEFAARYGFAPKNLVDFKALAGDASDNIPGVPGIGEVSATNLVQKYGSIEKIYKNLKNLPERMQKLLKEGEESSKMSKRLATIEVNVPIKLDLPACRVHDFESEQVKKVFEDLEFRSLIPKIPQAARQSVKNRSTSGSETNSNSRVSLEARQSTTNYTTDSPHFLTASDFAAKLDGKVDLILKKMSEVGVLVDLEFLERLGKELKGKLAHNEQEIYSVIGHQLNLNSPKQLSQVLFDELNLPVIKKTKTGRSTDEGTLRELITSHPVIPLILEYRQLFKLISTYVDALPKAVGEDGRIHSTFNVEGAATGRISSQNPNLQNIPIKGELGAELRKAFVVPKGKILLAADYSQIELRILAHIVDDSGLKVAFQQGVDVHTAAAAKIFNIPLDQITKEQRMVGKTVNFATLYGQGAHALSKQLGVEYKVAQAYIEEYFAQFPKVKKWKEEVLQKAKLDGYVETLWGRKRYIPELTAGNRMMMAFGERAAVNHSIQGTAADMIKKAMVEIDRELTGDSGQGTGKKNYNLKPVTCNLILQVHDELLFECSPKDVKEVGKMVKVKMENALKLSVPVTVDLKVGPNWGEMKPLKL